MITTPGCIHNEIWNTCEKCRPLLKPSSLFEQLAEIEHQRWADWQSYLHKNLVPHNRLDCRTTKNPEGIFDGYFLPKDKYDHWERQIRTPYAELSEQEKLSDRHQVLRYWPLIADLIQSRTSEKGKE